MTPEQVRQLFNPRSVALIGASEIIADRAEDEGIEIPEFAPETVEKLRRVVPPFAAVQNPVDVTGYILVNRELMRDALTAVQDDPGRDALITWRKP